MIDLDKAARPVWAGFLDAARIFPERPAIQVDGREVTYRELAKKALSLAATMQAANPGGEPLTAVFAYRSETSFAALLGVLLAGNGYVPLNRTFPIERTRLMLTRSIARMLVVDKASEPQLESLLKGVPSSLVIVCPDQTDVGALAAHFPAHRFIGANDLAPAEKWRSVAVSPDAIVYLLFTSGSTGQPKAVMVSHANVRHYVEYVSKRYRVTSADRMSQTFDMTFDLSAHDMFVAWENGACLCCPTQKQLINPRAYITNTRLSIWFSVPSTAVFMRRLGVLEPNMYPGLRLSLFCGEALPVEIVREWRRAAPNSVIENIYGPTELTIACTAYRWEDLHSPDECEQGLVPIGQSFPHMEALIVDEEMQEVKGDRAGELVMTGPQMCLGYWRDEEKMKRAFTTLPGRGSKVFYRTGDRVRRREPDKPLTYLGRLDSQIKILGHRVELGEVEAVVREICGLDAVAALGWPLTERGADGIELFIQSDGFDTKSLLEKLKSRLPSYMVPRSARALSHFPLNSNGKVDRVALRQRLENLDSEAFVPCSK
jgi:amino acid adenylation domain-containing protein